jgi:foldase protein PrsA
VALHLHLVKRRLETDPAQVPQLVDSAVTELTLALEEIRELVRDALYQDALRAEVVAGATPPEEDLQAEYQNRLDEFRQTKVSHILFRNQDRIVAQGVADQLQATPKNELPQVFRELAAQYSTDRASRAKGGNLGYFEPGQFVPEFEQAAAALPEGGISEPVRSEFGHHIIYVTDRRTRSFEDVRPQLEEEISTAAEDQVWQEWLFEAFSRVDIRVNPRYGEFDLETQQISDPGAGDVPGTEPPEESASPQS